MTKLIKTITLSLFLFSFTQAFAQSGHQKFTFPPEWEPHKSLWLAWQPWETDSAFCKVQCEMAQAISPFTPLTILFFSADMKADAFKRLATYGVDSTKVKSHFIPIENIWIRDAGPRFLKGKDGEVALANVKWTLYGYPKELTYADTNRGSINDSIAARLNMPTITSDIVSEGGGLDFSSTCILAFKETALQRNPGKTLEEIENEYLRVFGKQKMIWLNRSPLADKIICGPKAGNYFGWGANGHVDEYARFVNDSTILIAQIDHVNKDIDPLSKADYEILKENLSILLKAKNVNGKRFRIITLPTPALDLFARKEILSEKRKSTTLGKCLFKNFPHGAEIFWIPALSYLNYLVTNGVVLVPKYWREGLPEIQRQKDEFVKQIYMKVFPDRKVIQINPLAANWQGGGMHCLSQQEPK